MAYRMPFSHRAIADDLPTYAVERTRVLSGPILIGASCSAGAAASSVVASAIHGTLARRHGTGPLAASRCWRRRLVISAVAVVDMPTLCSMQAHTLLAERLSTVRNWANREVGKVAGV